MSGVCPNHKERLERIDGPYGVILVCPVSRCNYSRMLTFGEVPTSVHTPSTRCEQPDVLERTVVARIIAKLESAGYDVCVVGQKRANGSGSTIGYPDLSVRRSTWPRGVALLMEAKAGDGRLRPAQQELYEAGWSYVVRSAEDAIAALDEAEVAIGTLI